MNLVDFLLPKGIAYLELWRGDKLIAVDHFHNGITNQGKNAILDTFFNNATQAANWYIGLVDNAAFSLFSATDTPASHGGWVEWTATDNANRLTWGQGAAAGQQVTNASILSVGITATGTLQGIFVITDGSKGGNIGTLWSTALFTTPLPAESGDTLKLTFAVQM